jgi:hypothetical protein
MKTAVLWDDAQCNPEKAFRRFWNACCLLHPNQPEDGDSKNPEILQREMHTYVQRQRPVRPSYVLHVLATVHLYLK